MGSRFALVLLLAKMLSPSELGSYGLFVAAIVFSTLVVGGEYYTYAQREIAGSDRTTWGFVVLNQAIGTAGIYVIALPLLALIFLLGLLPRDLAYWFFAILILEHLAQEISRLLTIIGRPLAASWVLFVRMGVWVWPLVLVMALFPHTRCIGAVLSAWCAGVAVAVVVGVCCIRQSLAPAQQRKVNPTWIVRGFSVGALFLVSSLSIKLITTVDRFLVEQFVGQELLGVYVLYMGFAMALPQVVESTVISFAYPKVVGTLRAGDQEGYASAMRTFTASVILVSMVTALVIVLLAPWAVRWTGSPLYAQHLELLWVMVLGMIVYVVGLLPHYPLYALGADRIIVGIHVLSVPIFFGVTAISVPFLPFAAVAVGALAAYIWIGLAKFVALRKAAESRVFVAAQG